MSIHYLPRTISDKRLQILFDDYKAALEDFQKDWHNEQATQRYLRALRAWMDAQFARGGQ